MMQSHYPNPPFVWENLNMKVRLGPLVFDMLFDRNFNPGQFGRGFPIQTSPKHNHAAYEVHFIVSGSGSLFIDEHREQVKPGSIHMIGPHIFHTLRQHKLDPITRFTFRFTFHEKPTSEPWFPEAEASQMKALLDNLTYCQFPDTGGKISAMMDEFRLEAMQPSLGSYSKMQSLLAHALVHMLRSLPEARNEPPYTLSSKIKDEQRTEIVDLFFIRGYKDNLTIELLAEQLNLSVKQVNRLLQKQYGMSFKQKLMDTRIEVSKILLQSSTLSIQQIAEEVHYSAPYFSSVFLEKTGISPSQYRLLHQQPKP